MPGRFRSFAFPDDSVLMVESSPKPTTRSVETAACVAKPAVLRETAGAKR
jgi:hypothetical protein